MVRVHIWQPGLYGEYDEEQISSTDSELSLVGYVWNWGHVAIEVPDSDNEYVPLYYWSFWPPHYKPERFAYHYDDDIETCGREHDNIIEIEGLDEDSMREKWEEELEKDFHEVEHNCCTVAAALLRVGFGNSYTNDDDTVWNRTLGILTNPMASIFATFNLIVSDMSAWNPVTVGQLAEYIKDITEA